jgi:hypothetical protein
VSRAPLPVHISGTTCRRRRPLGGLVHHWNSIDTRPFSRIVWAGVVDANSGAGGGHPIGLTRGHDATRIPHDRANGERERHGRGPTQRTMSGRSGT